MMNNQVTKLIRAEALAEAWEIPVQSIYEKARQGLIPCVRVGRSIRFQPEVLEQFVNDGGQGLEDEK
jgi:hypothetical protein